jgi:hypothetical protein
MGYLQHTDMLIMFSSLIQEESSFQANPGTLSQAES